MQHLHSDFLCFVYFDELSVKSFNHIMLRRKFRCCQNDFYNSNLTNRLNDNVFFCEKGFKEVTFLAMIWLSFDLVWGFVIGNGSIHAKCVSVEDSFIFILTFTFQSANAFIISSWQLQKYKLMQRCIDMTKDDPGYYSGWSYQVHRLGCPDVQIVRYTHTCHYHPSTTCCLQNQFLDYIHLELDWSSSWSFAQCVFWVLSCFFMKMSDMHSA